MRSGSQSPAAYDHLDHYDAEDDDRLDHYYVEEDDDAGNFADEPQEAEAPAEEEDDEEDVGDDGEGEVIDPDEPENGGGRIIKRGGDEIVKAYGAACALLCSTFALKLKQKQATKIPPAAAASSTQSRPSPQQPQEEEGKPNLLPVLPPLNKFNVMIMVTGCSDPLEQRLTESSVEQGRLELDRDVVEGFLVPLMTEEEKIGFLGEDGIAVKVFDQKCKQYKMRFRRMVGGSDSDSEAVGAGCPVLEQGWSGFCEEQGLVAVEDSICLWMFHHALSHELCFAIIPRKLVYE